MTLNDKKTIAAYQAIEREAIDRFIRMLIAERVKDPDWMNRDRWQHAPIHPLWFKHCWDIWNDSDIVKVTFDAYYANFHYIERHPDRAMEQVSIPLDTLFPEKDE